MLYAGYYNLSESNKAAKSQASSRNTSLSNPTNNPVHAKPEMTKSPSVSSTSSANSISSDKKPSKKQSTLSKIIDQLKPLDEPISPWATERKPVVLRGSWSEIKRSEEWKRMSQWQKNAAVADMMR